MIIRCCLIGSLVFSIMIRALDGSGEPPIVNIVQVGDQAIVIRNAPDLSLPPVPGSSAGFDCNNALFWSHGRLYAFSSHEHPYRGSGTDLEHLDRPSTRVRFDNEETWAGGGRWIEAVHKSPEGPLYMWYHHEPKGLFEGLIAGHTAPRIGQMVSYDDGLNWTDQGTVIEAPRSSFVSGSTHNRYFGGGFGDFSVIPDNDSHFLYFFVSSYHKNMAHQGVTLARMPIEALTSPIGQVHFWRDGRWEEPALGGEATPLFPARKDWHAADADAFWGPSVHWNTALQKFVVLMNKSKNGNWEQDGIYLAIGHRLDDPSTWTAPAKILDSDDWYPQIIGISRGNRETDRLADRSARLFVKGKSLWTIEFQPSLEP